MTKTPIGFYKKGGKTHPINAPASKSFRKMPRATQLKIAKTMKGVDDPSVCNRADYYEDLDSWSIGEIEDAEGMRLVTDSQDIRALKEMGYDVEDYGGFFVRERNGEIFDVYGFSGSVPEYHKTIHAVGQDTSKALMNKMDRDIASLNAAKKTGKISRGHIFYTDASDGNRPFVLRKKGDYVYAVTMDSAKAATLNLKTGKIWGATAFMHPLTFIKKNPDNLSELKKTWRKR